MNFEQNRKQMLAKLSKLKRENVIKRKVASAKKKLAASDTQEIEIPSSRVKRRIIVYGQDSYFLRSIKQRLSTVYEIIGFEDEELACDYCVSNDISYVFLEMDEPTDWRTSTDLFTNIKTLNPQVTMFLFTADVENHHVQTLVAQGATILTKPVNFDELFNLL